MLRRTTRSTRTNQPLPYSTLFRSWQDDPAPFFAAADLYVVPSRHEPFGSVVLEGWMHSRPMVAAASQGPSLLIEDGENGLLVPIDDAVALAGALRRLIEEPQTAERLAQSGRAAYRSEEHTSELQYLMRISYAVFCLK